MKEYDVWYSLKDNKHYSEGVRNDGKGCTVTFIATGNIKLITVYPSEQNNDEMSEIVGTIVA